MLRETKIRILNEEGLAEDITAGFNIVISNYDHVNLLKGDVAAVMLYQRWDGLTWEVKKVFSRTRGLFGL